MHSFIIHVDGKAPGSLFENISEFAASQPNVLLIPKEETMNISWGGYNMVKATLNGMSMALKLGFDFDWLCNLSGASYPLVKNEAIRSKLASLPTANSVMMEVNPQPTEPAQVTYHVGVFYCVCFKSHFVSIGYMASFCGV